MLPDIAFITKMVEWENQRVDPWRISTESRAALCTSSDHRPAKGRKLFLGGDETVDS
jgi:hypothetical protein